MTLITRSKIIWEHKSIILITGSFLEQECEESAPKLKKVMEKKIDLEKMYFKFDFPWFITFK